MSQENILDYLRKTPHNTNVNVVKGMIDSTGSSLPEITAADNGKVLTVVEGQWDKADGGGVMIIHEDWSLDKTMEEIWEAVQRGTILVLIDSQGDYYQGAKVTVSDSGGSYYGTVKFNQGQLWEAHSADAYPEPNV